MSKVKFFQLLVLLVVLTFILIKFGPGLSDWEDWKKVYQPAALAMVHGKSPYSIEVFFAPPWSVIPLIPFAILPEKVGEVLYFLFGFGITAFILYKLGATPISMLIFLSSAPVIGYLTWGNIDWMPLLSLILPAPIALIFATTKPQIGIGFAIYTCLTTLKTKGLKEVIKILIPITLLTLLSFWVYGFWFLGYSVLLEKTAQTVRVDNISLWPEGLFIGFWLLYKSLQKENPRIGMAASPFISPYVSPFTWAAVLVALIQQPLELLIVSIGLWMPVLIKVVDQFLSIILQKK